MMYEDGRLIYEGEPVSSEYVEEVKNIEYKDIEYKDIDYSNL